MILERENPRYPKNLRDIQYPPKSLYCHGDLSYFDKYLVTVVGTRDISSYGFSVVRRLIERFLGNDDVVFVSGLASGVDGEVHRKCLRYGVKTIAVTAIDSVMSIPKCNRSLYRKLCKESLVISEFCSDMNISKNLYPVRNRILAGLSEITVVVEAGVDSGSLITADFALDANREVFSIPGNIFANTSHGCNILLSQGASPLINMDDFYEYVKEKVGKWKRLGN